MTLAAAQESAEVQPNMQHTLTFGGMWSAITSPLRLPQWWQPSLQRHHSSLSDRLTLEPASHMHSCQVPPAPHPENA